MNPNDVPEIRDDLIYEPPQERVDTKEHKDLREKFIRLGRQLIDTQARADIWGQRLKYLEAHLASHGCNNLKGGLCKYGPIVPKFEKNPYGRSEK